MDSRLEWNTTKDRSLKMHINCINPQAILMDYSGATSNNALAHTKKFNPSKESLYETTSGRIKACGLLSCTPGTGYPEKDHNPCSGLASLQGGTDDQVHVEQVYEAGQTTKSPSIKSARWDGRPSPRRDEPNSGTASIRRP
jgi:hypothetical protein